MLIGATLLILWLIIIMMLLRHMIFHAAMLRRYAAIDFAIFADFRHDDASRRFRRLRFYCFRYFDMLLLARRCAMARRRHATYAIYAI